MSIAHRFQRLISEFEELLELQRDTDPHVGVRLRSNPRLASKIQFNKERVSCLVDLVVDQFKSR